MNRPFPPEIGNYRPCVGIMLLNREGLVFIGQRRPKRASDGRPGDHLWQMPQGGIDPGENPYQAALRELAEETNVTSVSLIAEAPDWYTYDLPVDVTKKSWRGRYQGQRQKWFALRFEGADSEINRRRPDRRFPAGVRDVALGADGEPGGADHPLQALRLRECRARLRALRGALISPAHPDCVRPGMSRLGQLRRPSPPVD